MLPLPVLPLSKRALDAGHLQDVLEQVVTSKRQATWRQRYGEENQVCADAQGSLKSAVCESCH